MIKYAYFIFTIFLYIPAYARLSASSFPETMDALSFKSRIDLMIDVYEPMLDKQAYRELNIVPGEEFFTDQSVLSELANQEQEKQQEYDIQHMSRDEYCAKYPYDDAVCGSQTVQTTHTNNYACTTDWTIGGGTVTPNNVVTGGSCYPPDHAGKGRENRILTSGRYESISPAFEKAMITILRKEGGCGTIKADPGGYTCLGIAWNANKDKFPTPEDLKNITYAQAEDYYYKYFWVKYKMYTLPDSISSYYLWASMGSGPATAYNQFRKFLNVKSYNKYHQVDSEMVNAAKNYNGNLAKDWMDKFREPFLHQVEKQYEAKGSKINYSKGIELKRRNGCHVCPKNPLHRPAQPFQRKTK